MPNKSLWIWEDKLRRYRNTKTGRFIGISQMQELRIEYMDQQKAILRSYIKSYVDGDITIKRLEINIKDNLKQTYIDMYAMGAGGRNGMSQRDWGKIGAMLKEQYGVNGYLGNLMRQINNGEISPAQANARLKMYINSANEALWKGYTSDMPPLPAYPGDGSTVCLTNCQCEWDIQPTDGGFNCYWRLGPSEHCPDCLQRAAEWNPLFIPYGL